MNRGVRQFHRWTSLVFVMTVLANIVANALGQGTPPSDVITYSPLAPLALLTLTGLYLFVLPYVGRWRASRRTAQR